MGFAAHALSPVEIKAMLDAERRGEPFLAYRDGVGDLRLLPLGVRERLAIGRIAGNDLVLDWDPQVSRSHAQLERIGGDWALTDDGLSRNGSRVNGERIAGRRRLADGDVVRIGETTIVYRAPGVGNDSTVSANPAPEARLTDAERRVLVAMCAPFADVAAGSAPVPATNREIASALNLSQDGVKSHVRALFAKLGVGDLPQYRKRTELARRAIEHGIVTKADLSGRAPRR
jgi:DNA-binding CsgD family transcriptional regulator